MRSCPKASVLMSMRQLRMDWRVKPGNDRGESACANLRRRALRLLAAQMLVEPRQYLDEIARTVAVIELVHQDVVPRILAGAGGAGQAENISRFRNAGCRARLDRRRADLRV